MAMKAPRDGGAIKRRPAQRPKLPHERDETPGMTDGVPSERLEQAHKDVSRGLQDTSRAPEADRTYRRLKTKR